MHRLLLVLFLVLVAGTVFARSASAGTVTIDGTVYVDQNGNGALDAGEPTLAGVMVGFETRFLVAADANGHYSFTLPGDGIVWVRIPDGYEPTPVWRQLDLGDGSRTVDLGLIPAAATGNVTFVHATDPHIGNAVPLDQERRAFVLASQVEPRPHFIVITGDMTNDSTETSFQNLLSVVRDLDVPYVPVPGNHDAYDGGANYRKLIGPPEYCFDQGGMRFVVLDFSQWGNTEATFGLIDKCLADRGTRPAAAFVHAPVDDGTDATLAAHGIDYLFTGHWHSNRVIEHGTLEEINTQAFAMGGIDATPAGYRVVSFDGARLRYTHETVVDSPVLGVVWPAADGCAPPGALDAVVSSEAGVPTGPVAISLDGASAVQTAPHGGWDQVVTLQVAAGTHTLVATAGSATAMRTFCVAAPASPPQLADWPQLQGSAAHLGTRAETFAPPLEHVWARSVGGALRGGSVVVSGGTVFVPIVDLGDGTAGGVAALDAASGAPIWDKRTGYAVHNAPAVVDGLVVFGTSNGVVHAVTADTGADVWTYDLGEGFSQNMSWLYAAPTVLDGVVYIGVQRRFAALDAATGRELWSRDPSPNGFWLGSYSAAGAGGGVVIGAFSRGADGIVAWDAADGTELWRVMAPLATAVNPAIIVDGNDAFLGNSETTVFDLDLNAPASPPPTVWSKKLHDDADNFSYGLIGSPALTADRIVVPTMHGDVVALDRKSGAELWRYRGAAGSLRPVHGFGADEAAFVGAALVTGDLVWVGGADGRLTALDLVGGTEKYALDLGAPIFGGAVPAGDLLLVTTYDGTVHALRHVAAQTCPGATGCVGPPPSGGGCVVANTPDAPRPSPADLVWVLVAAVLGRRRRG